jgi:hypothetical protein
VKIASAKKSKDEGNKGQPKAKDFDESKAI